MSANITKTGYGPQKRVCIATGPGWSLYWPADEWQRLTDQEKTAVIAAQTALMNPSENTENHVKIRVGEAS